MRKLTMLLAALAATATAPFPAIAEANTASILAQLATDKAASAATLATSLKVSMLQGEAMTAPTAPTLSLGIADPDEQADETMMQRAEDGATGQLTTADRANIRAEAAAVDVAGEGQSTQLNVPGGLSSLNGSGSVTLRPASPGDAVQPVDVPAPGNNVGMSAEEKADGFVWGQPVAPGDPALQVIIPDSYFLKPR